MAAKAKQTAVKKAPRFSPEVLQEAERKRRQHRIIKNYLAALESRASNGHRRDPEVLRAKLASVEDALASATTIERLKLTQTKLDLEAELRGVEDTEPSGDFEALEAEFIEEIFDWCQRNGVSYTALRSIGVPAGVLRQGGLTRAS